MGFGAVGLDEPALLTRGVVLVPDDLTLTDWPERAKRAGLTTIGIHHQNSPQAVTDWIKADAGQRFLEACGGLGLEVEYELHAMKELLPRRLFDRNPEYFRMDDEGRRNPDANLCVLKPEPGVFLEYAPIRRRYDTPYEEQKEPDQADGLAALDANLEVFPAGTAQVLEYWLDVSRFSQWKRPAARLPWRRDVVEADVATYAARGIRHVTSFAVYVDAEYRRKYGEPTFIREYGETLMGRRSP